MPFNIPKEFIPHIIEIGKHLARTFAENRGGANLDSRVAGLEQAAKAVDSQLIGMRDAIDTNFRETRDKFQAIGEAFEQVRSDLSQQVAGMATSVEASHQIVQQLPTHLRNLRMLVVGLAIWNVVLTALVILALVRR